ncbi:hypothetical protein QZH41_017997 [Actinostola sp. cb2023]|nr:hypothetical protein QZH41_017997 [Actinostola sp. cb2023]
MAAKSGLRKRLCGRSGTVMWMMSLTSSFFLVEIVVGYMTNSMALVADSFHMLSDVMSLIIGLIALRYSKRSQRTDRNTFGWQRAEVLGALVNAVFLIALCFSILVESLKRLIETESIQNPTLVLIVGAAGLFINMIGLAMFHEHGHSHGGGHHHSHTPAINDRLVVVEEEEDDTESKEDDKDSRHSNPDSINSEYRILKTKEISEKVARARKNMPCLGLTLTIRYPYCGEVMFEIEVGAFLANENEAIHENGKTDSMHAHAHSKSPNKSKSGAAQLNMRAVYLHVLGDALGSVIVIISALIIKYASGPWTLYVDPVMSILLTCLILRTSIPLLKESSLILLQTVPTHIKIKEVQERLLEGVDGILSVHEFHVWQLAGDKIIGE